MSQTPFDVIFVGAGLANCLAAARLRLSHPHLKISLLEAASDLTRLRRTWSFHSEDFTVQGATALLSWLDQFQPICWRGYDVYFPNLERHLHGEYRSIRSDLFFAKIHKLLGEVIELGQRVESIDGASGQVHLADGSLRKAAVVFDGRGDHPKRPYRCAYQKFVGLEVETKDEHGLTVPRLMDATVAQIDGFRFIYVLPIGPRRLLIEDTRYSNDAAIDRNQFCNEIHRYALKQGWSIERVLESESGCLPIPLHSKMRPDLGDGRQLSIGLRSGLFHPVTGYSILFASLFADWLARQDWQNPSLLPKLIRQRQSRFWRKTQFFRRLNNMLFLAAPPQLRYLVLQKFYTRPLGMIQRFYALKMQWRDYVSLFSGRPPVRLSDGLRAFFTSSGGRRYGNREEGKLKQADQRS